MLSQACFVAQIHKFDQPNYTSKSQVNLGGYQCSPLKCFVMLKDPLTTIRLSSRALRLVVFWKWWRVCRKGLLPDQIHQPLKLLSPLWERN